MFSLVEFCNSNMLKGTEQLYEHLQEDPLIDCIDYECTNNCGLCSKSFFVLVNGEIVTAKDPALLEERIYQRIEKHNKQQEEIYNLLDSEE
jgi:uncharacterized protein YuzB (UPF0349 family)